ncbi:MAG: FCD domain-containing protein [Syntrophobacter sp.]
MNHLKSGYTVYKSIFDWIFQGKIQSGDKLPSATKISEDLSVSVGSVREALQNLATIGFLDIVHGKGIFVTQGESLITEIFEARKILECMNVEMAARKITADHLNGLKREMERMEIILRSGNIRPFTDHDYNFHAIISEACGNRFIRKAYENTSNFTFYHLATVHAYPGNPDMSCEHHRRIVDALEKGDGARARREMHIHLDTAQKIALKVIESQIEQSRYNHDEAQAECGDYRAR